MSNDSQYSCRICLEYGDKQTMLSGICACKSDGNPIYEHRECVIEQIENGSSSCSVCKQDYNIRYKASISKAARLLFKCAVYPVVLALAVNILLIGHIQPQQPPLHMRIMIGWGLLCSIQPHKPSASYALVIMLALLAFIVLDIIHFDVYHGGYLIHPGFVLIVCTPNEKAARRYARRATLLY